MKTKVFSARNANKEAEGSLSFEGLSLPSFNLTFKYATGGTDCPLMECCAKMVSRLVTPSITRSVTSSGFIQKENQETTTMMMVGK